LTRLRVTISIYKHQEDSSNWFSHGRPTQLSKEDRGVPSFLDIPSGPNKRTTNFGTETFRTFFSFLSSSPYSKFSLHARILSQLTRTLQTFFKLLGPAYKEVCIRIAVADLISARISPFIAPIILYFAKQYGLRKGWLNTSSNPSNYIDCRAP